jgi:GNAT superfamily N-acetyltransferase
MKLVGPQLSRMPECEAVLRTLPMWFGIEDALIEYVEATAKYPTFAIELEGSLMAFLTLREHFASAWEVHCMAVSAPMRGRGLGSRLLAHSEDWLKAKGVEFLQVKTVAASSSSKAYAETRTFYEAKGFMPLEVFPELWDPWNPALQCIKHLGGPRSGCTLSLACRQ